MNECFLCGHSVGYHKLSVESNPKDPKVFCHSVACSGEACKCSAGFKDVWYAITKLDIEGIDN